MENLKNIEKYKFYKKFFSEITASLINKSNLRIGFRSLNKISKFIKVCT